MPIDSRRTRKAAKKAGSASITRSLLRNLERQVNPWYQEAPRGTKRARKNG